MSTEKKSFWSSLPGMVTGVAGVVGAIVGLVGVLISLGVIGGSNSSPTVTTVPGSDTPGATSASSGSSGGTGGGTTASTTPKGSFTVDKNKVTVSLLNNDATVMVTNTGRAPLKLNPPRVTGQDSDRFKVDSAACTGITLGAGNSCPIKVTLLGAGAASATMLLDSNDAVASSSVSLTGSL